jgi:hypothetical protein
MYIAQNGEDPQLIGTVDWNTSARLLDVLQSGDPSSSSGSFTDAFVTLDTPFVYTTENILASDPWPAFYDMAKTTRRLFGISALDRGTLFYSKIFQDGIAPEFSSALTITLGETRRLTAVAAIEDKILVFEKDQINVLYGTGPDNAGLNGEYTVEPIHTQVGTEDPRSVVLTEDGVMFYSRVTGEFHLVTRDLQVKEIGSPVQDISERSTFSFYDSINYVAEHEARFFVNLGPTLAEYPTPDTGTGIPDAPPQGRYARQPGGGANICLVYNYRYQKWTINTDNTPARFALANGAFEWDNRPAFVNAFWVPYTLGDERGTEWATSEPMKVELPWLKLNQLQNYGRVYNITLLAKYMSEWKDNGSGIEAGDLQVTLAYDYEENGTTHTYRFRANQDFNATGREILQLHIRPGRQKCQAVKVTIEEIPTTAIELSEPTYAPGRGFTLLGMDVEYGYKAHQVKSGNQRNRK